MEQLTDLDAYRRAKASPRFGPKTLHGQQVVMPDESIGHLPPTQRVLRAIERGPISRTHIADITCLGCHEVQRICTQLQREGAIEKTPYTNPANPCLYRLKNNCRSGLDLRNPMCYNGGNSPHGPSAA